MGWNDISIKKARKILPNKIIGMTCNNSIKKAKEALKAKASYIALGAFNSSKTKKVKYKATINDLKKIRKITNKPIIAIGGINQYNYKKLLLNKADFLAISSFIWKNNKLKPIDAIKNKMKISGNEIKTGMIIEHNNDLWEVLKTQHVKPGKGGAFNQVE